MSGGWQPGKQPQRNSQGKGSAKSSEATGKKNKKLIVTSGNLHARHALVDVDCKEYVQFLWKPGDDFKHKEGESLAKRLRDEFIRFADCDNLPVGTVLPYPAQVEGEGKDQVLVCAAIYLNGPVKLLQNDLFGDKQAKCASFFELPELNATDSKGSYTPETYTARDVAVAEEVERWCIYAKSPDDAEKKTIRRQILRRILHECSSACGGPRNLSDFTTEEVFGPLKKSQQEQLIKEVKAETGNAADRYIYTFEDDKANSYELIFFVDTAANQKGMRLQLNSSDGLPDDLEAVMKALQKPLNDPTTVVPTEPIFRSPKLSPKNVKAWGNQFFQAESIDGVDKLGTEPVKMREKKGKGYNVEVREPLEPPLFPDQTTPISTHNYTGPPVALNLVMHYKRGKRVSPDLIDNLNEKLKRLRGQAQVLRNELKELWSTGNVLKRVKFKAVTLTSYKFTNPPVVRQDGVTYRSNAYDTEESTHKKLVDAVFFGLPCEYEGKSVKVHAVACHYYSVLESVNAYHSSYAKNDADFDVYVYVHYVTNETSRKVCFSKLQVDGGPLVSHPEGTRRKNPTQAFLAIAAEPKWIVESRESVAAYATRIIEALETANENSSITYD